ncbi:MAG: dihydroneopterin aldolase [Bacteroidetes bacterium]|nr:dihydroneopterin aldolase [Bacteroidota bacterium]MBS1757528.1 dihydroneopterin aldolase [Bacteroidota bacterium]
MVTIHLNNLRFFAHHGVHAEEAIIGNDFEVSVEVAFDVPEKVQSLSDTVNYVSIYQAIKNTFIHPSKLLETLAGNICDEIYKTDNRIKNINITIYKLNPPIPNFIGNVGVSYSKCY